MSETENKQEAQKPQEQILSQQVVETPKEEAPKSSKEWDAFRQARAQERKQAEEMSKQAQKSAAEAAALKAALESALQRPVQQQPQQGYGYEQQEETEEQRIEKKVAEAIARKEQEYEKQRREREQAEYPQRLVSTYNDFNQVCNEENLDYLEYHYPEVASAFKQSPEGYDKWSAIYRAVKRFVPNTDSRKDAAKAERNLSKPGSISSPSVSQGGGQQTPASRLDDDRKAANWARMQRAIKGIG